MAEKKTDKAKRAACRAVVMSFRNYHGFPEGETEDGVREIVNLVDALDRWTVNADHANAVGRKLLEESKFCPRVVDFREVGEGLRTQFVPQVIGVVCGGVCTNGYVLVSDEGQGHMDECVCRKGFKKRPAAEPIPPHPQAPKAMKPAAGLLFDGRMKAAGED